MRSFRPARRALPIVLAAAVVSALAVAGLRWHARPPPLHLAIAASLHGSDAPVGEENLSATRLYVDEVNRGGGVDGHEIVLDVFDDRSAIDTAKANVPAILDGPALAVLGHFLSTVSVAVGPMYRDGHIPALSAFSYADGLTRDNPYYFRAQVTNGRQGRWTMDYIRNVLRPRDSLYMQESAIHLVYSDDVFGQTFWAGASGADGGPPAKSFAFDNGAGRDDSARDVAEQLAQEPEPRIIVIGAAPNGIEAVLKAIRRRGIHSIVFGAGGSATEAFVREFADEPEERESPGFFTDNYFVGAPLIFDSAGAEAQSFATHYTAETGQRPSYVAAQATDAARIMVEALRRAHPRATPESRAADREAVRAALAGMDSETHGVRGLDGLLYFDANRDMDRPQRLGFFRKGRLVSAPTQLVAVQHPELVDLDGEVRRRHIVRIGSNYYWLQRVVYTGIDLNDLSRINLRDGRFHADFFLWMRYAGGDDEPVDVEFPDLAAPEGGAAPFDHAAPAAVGREDELRYRLYRVDGTFRADFDLHDYPFDAQHLLIRLQNTHQSREQVAYVVDVFGLQQDKQLPPLETREAFRELQLWHPRAVQYFVSSFVNHSTLGKPAFFETETRTEYPVFDTDIVIRRDYLAFMVKTLMPMFLLVLVVFATLWFPPSLAKERTTIPVTAILTTAVLMISINSQLPPIGYTVSIEFVFYIFFALCLMSMVAGFVKEIQRERGHKIAVVVTDVSARVTYGLVVAATVAYFFWKYA